MVSRKSLDYGFHGYQAPVIPRAPRSIRRRIPFKDSFEDGKLSAFELLAAVASKLLQESERSGSNNVAREKDQPIDAKALKSDSFELGSCPESVFVPDISIQDQNPYPNIKEKPQSVFNSILEHTFEPMSSDVLEKFVCDVKREECKLKMIENSVERSAYFGDSFNFKVESGPKMHSGNEKCQIGELPVAKAFIVKEPSEECVNSNMTIISDCSVQLPVYREPIVDACMQKQSTDVKLGFRDDDENSYRCQKLSTKGRLFKPQPQAKHCRIRKMMTSKYRKVAPRRKSYELSYTSDGMKLYYQYRKRIYTQERCQAAPIKKRKLSYNRFSVANDQDTSSDSISNLPEKGNRTASGTMKARSKAVKFSIKSFKVPELYIEVPETESIGSLKRTVMEAVKAILGSGIRVGVLLQGKKVSDDNRTLQQAGISPSNDLDALGFTLEPCFAHVSSPKAAAKKPSTVLTFEENPELPRSSPTPVIASAISNASLDLPTTPVVTKSNDEDIDKGLTLSPQEPPMEELIDRAVATGVTDPNNALVSSPSMNLSPLAGVYVNPKLKRSELSQRRTRKPFSVAEVEALVGAVEKLGTGRWRDVKIVAFGNADHRTYVDLKDKWKTLVHTASISPHQRRGEPVPQDLLDRVLVAHSSASVESTWEARVS